MAPTPPPPSVAASETDSGPLTKVSGQAAPLQAMLVVGVPSERVKVVSADVVWLPAASVAIAFSLWVPSASEPGSVNW